eukprot:596255-Heterocapsa_arctica.AAC.1
MSCSNAFHPNDSLSTRLHPKQSYYVFTRGAKPTRRNKSEGCRPVCYMFRLRGDLLGHFIVIIIIIIII